MAISDFDWYFRDNGFSSKHAMATAHKPIVELASVELSGVSGTVMDLGCGNGALLERICSENNGLVPYGVDLDPAKIAHAHAIVPSFYQNFTVGDFFIEENVWPLGRRFDLVILMPGRLLEVPDYRRNRLKERLAESARTILVYAYGDWFARYNSLSNLVERAGLYFTHDGTDRSVGIARVTSS